MNANNANKKTLRKQGLTISSTPTKAQRKTVSGDYQRFDQVAIDCVQFVERLMKLKSDQFERKLVGSEK